MLSWARGSVDEHTIARSAEAIEKMNNDVESAGGSEKRQTICRAIKTLFQEVAPVKNDANFFSAVLHVRKQVDKWLFVALYLPSPVVND